MNLDAWPRRKLLAGLALLAGSAFVPRLKWGGTPTAMRRAERLVSTLRRPHAAARIGALYLAAAPEEARIETLVQLLGAGARLDRTSSTGLAEHYRAQQRDDFAHERVAKVDGWLLSRSEARLYALAALLDA